MERCDEVGADALRHEVAREGDRGVDRPGAAVGAHRDPRHALDAAADGGERLTRHHLGRRHVHGLQTGGAEAVDLHAGHRLVVSGHQRGDARDVRALLSDRHHAAEHDVFDEPGVERGAVAQGDEHLPREFDGGHLVERAVALAFAARGPHVVVDEGVHDSLREAGPCSVILSTV